jgi:hypothetical protein
MKKKELLKEIMGVPKSITPWVNSFTKIITDVIAEESKYGYEQEGEITYKDPKSGEEITDIAYKTENIVIPGDEFMERLMEFNGYSDMKDFIKSDMFKGLPLWRPEISFGVVAVPDVLYEKDPPSIEAAVLGSLTQKLSNIGKVPVFPNVNFNFNIIIPIGGPSSKFLSELKSTVSHELLHTYQKIKQLESGGESHYGKETILNALANHPMLNEIEIGWWKKFLHMVYLHLSFEINARITQLYYDFEEKGIKTKEDFLTELKKSNIWKQMKLLENFNAEEYIKEFELPSDEIDMVNFNPLEALHMLLQGKMSLKDRGIDVSSEENAIKSLIDLWDKTLKIGNEGVKNKYGIDFNMLPVPDTAKKDPYLFFKFFEKRFHNKAQKWKRKLYRIGSLLIED